VLAGPAGLDEAGLGAGSEVGAPDGQPGDHDDVDQFGVAEIDFKMADDSADGVADGHLVPIQMEGDGPLVVREKVHTAKPITIDQAPLEMELVGHDFYLFHDVNCDRFSVVYRRRGYDYGVIRLIEE